MEIFSVYFISPWKIICFLSYLYHLRHSTLSSSEAMAMAVRLLVLLNTLVSESAVYGDCVTEHQRSTTFYRGE